MKASESVMSDRLDKLRRLLDALTMARGGSSSLDDEIGRLLDPIEHRHSGSHPLAGVSARNDATPLFSSNIDVAIGFAVQMTGAQSWAISFGKCSKAKPFSVAFLYADETGEALIAEGEAATPALAICAAMIHAEIEKQDR